MVFKHHDLVGINFSNFITSNSDIYQVLSGSPTVSSKDDHESSQKQIFKRTGCPEETVAS